MRLADLVQPLRLRCATRWVVAVGVLVAAVVLALTAETRVPHLIADPSLPDVRVTILVACLASNLLVAWTRPILPLDELLTARVAWAHRLVAVLLGMAVPVAVIVVLAPSGSAGDALIRLAGFAGIGLVGAAFAPGLGVVAPWVYAISGLAFGYRTTVGSAAELSPWAWMIGETTSGWPQVVLLLVGLALVAWREPRVPDGALVA